MKMPIKDVRSDIDSMTAMLRRWDDINNKLDHGNAWEGPEYAAKETNEVVLWLRALRDKLAAYEQECIK